MARNAFYSFHFTADHWRASQVRNIGTVEGNKPATDNEWQAVERGGERAIKAWIDNQLSGRSAVVVLIGTNSAGRKWINYEIAKGWNDGKGVLGIHVHNLKHADGSQSVKGLNPFDSFKLNDGTSLSSIVRVYDPPFLDSKSVYEHIEGNLADWIEDAVAIRDRHK